MKAFTISVRVSLKDGILNPEAEAVKKSLQRLSITSVEDLSIERHYVFKIKAEQQSEALEVGRKMARELLSNIVMENFEVEALS